jgi:iron-sulfur cluster repair protein YtfE (RIC family)
MMDPFELLRKDHEIVSKLFERLESLSGKAKLGVFQQIKSELDLHTHIEEAIFYPALERANETRDLTLEAYEEHKVVKDLLSELDTAKSVSDEWEAKLKVLRENVEHHVDEEENELFDKANDVLTGEEAERLGDRMSAEKVKRGAPAPKPTSEKSGLLQKIAHTLGIGTGPQKASETPRRKKAAKAQATKKTGRTAAKAAGSKSTKSSKPPATKKSASVKIASGTKSRSNASREGAAKKSGAARGTTARKKGAAKKSKRGR